MTAVPRPDLIPAYRQRFAAEMPLGRPEDVNITSIVDTVIEPAETLRRDKLGLGVPQIERIVPRYTEE